MICLGLFCLLIPIFKDKVFMFKLFSREYEIVF